RQGKWTAEEKLLVIRARNNNEKWNDIAAHFPGRTGMACRLHFQNYTEKDAWTEVEMDKFARLYERYKMNMFLQIAKDMDKPVRACERIHWSLGAEELHRRAN
ncbi:hypothetical protein K490DRAFT_14112, partial [Saccharata proteae CBS 121410]